jgi:hypothetical protein
MTFLPSFDAFHRLQCEMILELIEPTMNFIKEQRDPDLFALYRKIEHFSNLHHQFRNRLGAYKIRMRRDMCEQLHRVCEVISEVSVSICLLLGKYFQLHKPGFNERAHDLRRLSSTYYMRWVCRMRAHGLKIPALHTLCLDEKS